LKKVYYKTEYRVFDITSFAEVIKSSNLRILAAGKTNVKVSIKSASSAGVI
jgi:hypothetical protein